MEILELKSAISKRKNSLDGFNMTKAMVSKFEDKTIKIIQSLK